MLDKQNILNEIYRKILSNETNQQYGRKKMRPLTVYNKFLSIALRTMTMKEAILLYKKFKNNPKKIDAVISTGDVNIASWQAQR